MSSIKNKIWYFLVDSVTNEKYAGLIVRKYQKWELASNVFLTLVTSSSIAAWAVWEIYPFLWIIIIAISQILTITKPYFLFPKYIKVFNEKSLHWQHLSVSLEKLWHEYNEGYLNDKEGSDKYFELKTKSLSFDNIPDDLIFFDHNKQHKLAEKFCEIELKKIA